MAMKILDVPISSISEVKRSPMEIFKKADKEAAGVYVFNREKVAGVMLTQKQYETLNEEVDSLYDKIADLIAENRLQHEKVTTFSDSEVRGSIANEVPTIDEEDGWEQALHQIEWTEYSKEDYDNLDGSQKVFVDKAIERIKLRGMDAGQPLHGALAQCNKLKNKKMGLRVIFREVEGKFEVIQIVVIGKRDKKTVYKIAENRIN